MTQDSPALAARPSADATQPSEAGSQFDEGMEGEE